MRRARRDLPLATLWYPAQDQKNHRCQGRGVNEAWEERGWWIRAAMLTGVDDHAVGEVGAIRAQGPTGGATPLLHPQN
jgi:hypothetical protein